MSPENRPVVAQELPVLFRAIAFLLGLIRNGRVSTLLFRNFVWVAGLRNRMLNQACSRDERSCFIKQRRSDKTDKYQRA
jgi:hypothetical protein